MIIRKIRWTAYLDLLLWCSRSRIFTAKGISSPSVLTACFLQVLWHVRTSGTVSLYSWASHKEAKTLSLDFVGHCKWDYVHLLNIHDKKVCGHLRDTSSKPVVHSRRDYLEHVSGAFCDYDSCWGYSYFVTYPVSLTYFTAALVSLSQWMRSVRRKNLSARDPCVLVSWKTDGSTRKLVSTWCA